MQPSHCARAFLVFLPIFSMGCVSLSPKLSTLPSVAKSRADVQYQAAQMAEERGQWQKARELYTALHRNSPENPTFAHRVAYACMQMGDFQSATRYFELARRLGPENPDLLFDMGMAAYLQKEYSRAESLFAETVRLNPEDARATNSLAMSIGFQKRYEESLDAFRKVNNETQSLLNVAYVYSQTNEPDQAIAYYQRVLVNDPQNPYATTALRQLQSTRPAPVSAAARKSSTVIQTTHVTAPVQLKPVDFQQDSFAPPQRTNVVQLVSNTSMPSDTTSAVIITPAEIPARTDFQAPVITPLYSLPQPAPVIAPNPPREINQAPVASPVLPQPVPPQPVPPQPVPPQPVPPQPVPPQLGPPQPALPPQELTTEQTAEVPKQVPVREEVLEVPAATAAPEVPVAPATVPLDTPVSDQGHVPVETAAPASEEVTELEWARPELARQLEGAPQEIVAVRKDDCFRGFCPVAIRDERRLKSASDEFSFEFQGHTYRFSSGDALIRFQEHPEWYVPVAGGIDIIDVKQGQGMTRGSLEYAVWFRHRLHMFSSAENLAVFRTDPHSFLISP